MGYMKYFAGLIVAAGMLAIGASPASAQDRVYNQQPNLNQYQAPSQYYRSQYSGNSYDRIEELQEHVARDRARLDEDIRCGRDADAARQAADLARDQRLLQEQTREVGAYQYRRPYTRGWSFRFGWR